MSRVSAAAPELPEGFRYIRDFLSQVEERELLRTFERLPFRAFQFQGYTAKRRVVEYGWEYDFTARAASTTQSIPPFLFVLRERAATLIGMAPEALVEAVVTEYPAGAQIGWHRDVPQFETIIGVSLGGGCRMRLKPYRSQGKLVSCTLEPRSAYVISGAARWKYQHSIPAVKALRYSITFRTLRAKSGRMAA